jgi:hypothetical protein
MAAEAADLKQSLQRAWQQEGVNPATMAAAGSAGLHRVLPRWSGQGMIPDEQAPRS